ncbi:MAG TPA: peptidoglycan-binding protein [Oscillatoriaceae cyanobacterium]
MSTWTSPLLGRLALWGARPRGGAAPQPAPSSGGSAPVPAGTLGLDSYTPSARRAASAAEPIGGSAPMLSQGSSGSAVRTLQQELANDGFSPGGIDGIFGPNTAAAVRRFQQARGLQVDGIVGPQTEGALNGAPAAASSSGMLQQGSSGAAVRTLQQQLANAGFSPGGIDGIFGPQTRAAVQAYQASRGLSVDGIVGPQTQGALNANAPGAPNSGNSWTPGAGQLQGADTSSWQSQGSFEQSIAGDQWTAIKASEGTTFTDPTFQARWNELGQKIQSGQMKLRMAYLFLTPGDGAAEAQHFLDVVGVHGPLPAGTRLALDWEASALNSPSTLQQAANYIHQVTGIWPVIYVQGSKMAEAQSLVPQAPIWEAAWGPSPNPNVPFVQYNDGPGFDHDVFNGDPAALAKFAGF